MTTKQKLPEILTEKEVQSMLKATKNPRHRLAFALGFYECLRISEVACLLPENVNKEIKLLLIKGSDVAKGKKGAKRGKDRNIPIAPEVIKGLKYLPVGSLTAKDSGIRALQIAFKKKLLEVLGRTDLSFHCLRHCVSDDVEVLTKEGWKKRINLKKGEMISSLNLENDSIILNPIKEIHKYSHNGPINQIKTKYINCLFTDEHKFLIQKREKENLGSGTRWGKWYLKKFKDFNTTQFKIRLSGTKEEGLSIGKEKAFIIGLILGDGCIKPQKQRDGRLSGKYSIVISQSLTANPKKVKEIRRCFIKSGIKFSEIKEKVKLNNFNGKPYQMVYFHPFQNKMDWVFDWINKDRTPKNNLLNLNGLELKEIYKAMMLCDGSRGNEYCGQKKKRIDFFVTLCHLIGKRTLVSKGILNMGKNKGKEKSRIYISKNNSCQVNKWNISKTNYKGVVWCPEVKSQTFIARRRDKIFISGNSGVTHYLVKGWSSLEVQRLAGHARIATTEIYAHINPQNLVNRMWEEK